MDQNKIERYWQAYLATLPDDATARQQGYVAEQLGDNPDLANRLGSLIVQGIKTATCSALWEWEAENNPLAEVGLKTIVLDGADEPLCIVETTEITIRRFDEVDARFAAEEGEGDRSLDYWRTAHWSFFLRTLPRIGRQPALDMPLVCERFRVVYPES
ncbi:MAG TPA: ASCH domain-containing protein [Herpetosiphonaceae bacterium]